MEGTLEISKQQQILIGSHIKFLKFLLELVIFANVLISANKKMLSTFLVTHLNNTTSSYILPFYTSTLAQIPNRKETSAYNLKTRKTSPCKTAVSVISVFKSYTMLNNGYPTELQFTQPHSPTDDWRRVKRVADFGCTIFNPLSKMARGHVLQ